MFFASYGSVHISCLFHINKFMTVVFFRKSFKCSLFMFLYSFFKIGSHSYIQSSGITCKNIYETIISFHIELFVISLIMIP